MQGDDESRPVELEDVAHLRTDTSSSRLCADVHVARARTFGRARTLSVVLSSTITLIWATAVRDGPQVYTSTTSILIFGTAFPAAPPGGGNGQRVRVRGRAHA